VKSEKYNTNYAGTEAKLKLITSNAKH